MNRIIRAGTPLVTALFLFATAGNTASDFTVLDSSLGELKSAFNADTGKLRLVMYVSPTCGGCLRGAQQTQENLLAALLSERQRAARTSCCGLVSEVDGSGAL